MNFQDIFKKSFLDGFTSFASAGQILAALSVTCLLSLYIFLIYRLLTRKAFYSKGFNVSLAALAVLTSSLILAMQSSLVISLGMVGALSIVRFRTAIKDPLDLVFLFWSVSIGIICGAGLYEVAFLTCIVVTALICILENLPVQRAPMLLVATLSEPGAERLLLDTVRKSSRFYRVKSRTISDAGMDIVVEIRVKKEAEFLEQITAIEQVETASLISHDGEAVF